MGINKSFPAWVRHLVGRGQHGYCKLCLNKLKDYHHRLPDTVTNTKLFPLFINSIFNAVGLCRGCHDRRIKEVRITHDEALVYEEWLNEMMDGELIKQITGEEKNEDNAADGFYSREGDGS